MRKLLVILLLVAFLMPVPGPTAHSAVPGLCALKGKSCEKHEKSCPLESHAVRSGSTHHEMRHAVPPAKKGAPSLKCGCSTHGSADMVRTHVDPFTTGRLPLPSDSSEGPFIEVAALIDSSPLIPIRTKPPAV